MLCFFYWSDYYCIIRCTLCIVCRDLMWSSRPFTSKSCKMYVVFPYGSALDYFSNYIPKVWMCICALGYFFGQYSKWGLTKDLCIGSHELLPPGDHLAMHPRILFALPTAWSCCLLILQSSKISTPKFFFSVFLTNTVPQCCTLSNDSFSIDALFWI